MPESALESRIKSEPVEDDCTGANGERGLEESDNTGNDSSQPEKPGNGNRTLKSKSWPPSKNNSSGKDLILSDDENSLYQSLQRLVLTPRPISPLKDFDAHPDLGCVKQNYSNSSKSELAGSSLNDDEADLKPRLIAQEDDDDPEPKVVGINIGDFVSMVVNQSLS